MLVSCKLTGNPADVAKYHTKDENYYFAQAAGVESLQGDAGAQSHVTVHGRLCETLQLVPGQMIDERQFTNILGGNDARGNKLLGTGRGRPRTTNGIDLTFSAPKSVSLAGLLTERDPRIIEAHDRAVRETMQEIERGAGTRVNGEPVHTGKMAYVTVRDGFNRDHDPHLHTHVVVMNMTVNGQAVLTLNNNQIFRREFNKLWGAMYRAKLASHLREAGYSISYTKKGELRLDSVSIELEREFSGRRAQILKEKQGGERDMAAWRNTRKAKEAGVEKSRVLANWKVRLGRHMAKPVEQNREEAQTAREAWFREAKWSVEARQELAGLRGDSEAARWQLAARRATETSAAVSAEAVITEYLTELARGERWQPIGYAEAERRLSGEVRAGRLLMTDSGRYTTWEMARADRECLKARPAMPGLALPMGTASVQIQQYAKAQEASGRRGLSRQQAAAAAGVLAAPQAVVVVQGDAGAGKTTMLRAVKDVAATAGWDLVGVSVQGVAARQLQAESGISSTTVASYLSQERSEAARGQTRRSRLVVVDESSMLGSRDLAELLRQAQAHGDKVVLVGDRNQVQGVGAGRPFARLVEAAERSGQLLSLSENYRQRDKELLEAVDLARAGKMAESVSLLDRTGRVLEIEDTSLRRVAVAHQYDKNTLIVAGSRESRDALNQIIREDLAKRGIVDRATAHNYPLCWSDPDGVPHMEVRELAVGDVVTFLENEYRNYDVRNGERGEVTKASGRSLAIRLEDGRSVDIDLREYSALDYGYALTTYKAQGQTYDRVIVEADTKEAQLQDQRNTYVQITRGRDDVRLFTDDKIALREAAEVLNFKVDTLEIAADFERTARMERRVYAEVFGDRDQGRDRATGAAVGLAEEKPNDDREKQEASPEAGASAAPPEQGRGSDRPFHPETTSTIQGSETVPSSLPADLSSFDTSVRENIGNFNRLFGKEPLTGMAEKLRDELTKAAAEAPEKARKEIVEERLAELDVTTDALVNGYKRVTALPANQQRDLMENLRCEVERRLMLKNILPSDEVRRAHEGLRTSMAETLDPTKIRVRNLQVLLQYGDVDVLLNGCFKQFKAIESRLEGRPDLNLEEKRRVAAELSKPENARVFGAHLTEPERAVAVGVFRSGVRDLDGATQGLDESERIAVQEYIEREQARSEQKGRDQGEGRSRGHER